MLKGLRILLTRPEQQQEILKQQLERCGAVVQSYPVLAIKGLDKGQDVEQYQRCKQQWMRLDEFKHVIFISTNAVQFGLEWVGAFWPQLPVGLQWYAIGAATAEALSKYGIEATQARGSMNSEALLALPELQSVTGDKVLIVRGVGGRDYLQQQLQQRGAVVEYAECYRRTVPEAATGELVALMEEQSFDVVCVMSGESLQNLSQLLGSQKELLHQKNLLVPGQRVAGKAKALGCQRLIVAENASVDGLLQALEASALIQAGPGHH